MDAVPCPACGGTNTIESTMRQTVELYKQADSIKYAQSYVDVELGIAEHPHPALAAHTHALGAHTHSINQPVDLGADPHGRVDFAMLIGVETCSDCGILYRPNIKRVKSLVERHLATAQRTFLLDAIAQEAR